MFGTQSNATGLKLVAHERPGALPGGGNLFKPGRWAEFSFRTKQLGELDRVLIGHEDEDKKWFVDKIEVTCKQRCEQTLFLPQRWLAKSEGDGNLNTEINPSEITYGKPKTKYNIAISTGEQGTQGDVFITIFGSWGKTDEIALRKSTSQFGANKTDDFELEDIDVGEIDKIRFRYNPVESESWNLKSVQISRIDPIKLQRLPSKAWAKRNVTPKYTYDHRKEINFDKTDFNLKYQFNCEQNFKPSKAVPTPVHEFLHKLLVSNRHKIDAKKSSYDVVLQTSQSSQKLKDSKDCKFLVNIIGTKSDSGFREFCGQIPDSGKQATLNIEALNIGMPETVIVKTDSSLKWILDSVNLLNSKKEFYFPAEVSFNVSEVTGQINHTLIPMNKNLVKDQYSTSKSSKNGLISLWKKFGLEMKLGKVVYRVRTFTNSANDIENGDENVYFYLLGNFAKSEKFILSQSLLNKNSFQSGQTDEFDLETVNLGSVESILIGWKSKNTNLHQIPFEKIEIRAGQTGYQWSFNGSSNSEETEQNRNINGFCERTLHHLPSFERKFEPLQFYEIRVKTSESFKEGSTEANVYLQLYGDERKSEVLNLVPRKDLRSKHFNLGSEDVFIR